MTLFSLSFLLFLIMDPIGNASSYLKLVQGLPADRQRYVTFREMGIALLTMLLFFLIGEGLARILDLSDLVVRLASGLILFLAAIKILFSSPDNPRNNLSLDEEPFIIPLAIPLIAGPALLATIMLYSMSESASLMFSAIVLAWLAAVLVFEFSPFLQRVLGKNGLTACERLMGTILVLLAIQRFFDGIQQFVLKCKNC